MAADPRVLFLTTPVPVLPAAAAVPKVPPAALCAMFAVPPTALRVVLVAVRHEPHRQMPAMVRIVTGICMNRVVLKVAMPKCQDLHSLERVLPAWG